ncbi:unnamed protein product, partial [Prorocentrum cordatum]
ARGVGLSFFAHLSAIGLPRWWWLSAPWVSRVPSTPPSASAGLGHSAGEACEVGARLVPLSECISAVVEAPEEQSCPVPCTPCLACPVAGDAGLSWLSQLVISLLGLIFLQAGKLLLGAAARLPLVLRGLLASCSCGGSAQGSASPLGLEPA